ncbi:DUF6660 family protein [Flavobacterium supellecticarium]|uniref:DUF6660 family protein n=1 Tax=Flavobacterium supellecticarium TaxID=2565924 RepID=UPI001E296BC6|nr:DUF6660 family protein [Flavobacterium supellecticarium]
MKWLTVLLSFYFVLLASIPCADAATGHTHFRVQNETPVDHEGHSHEKQGDLCSPFCVCNCCGAQIMNYAPVIAFAVQPITPVITTPTTSYQSVFYSGYYGSIWQPPQLV